MPAPYFAHWGVVFRFTIGGALLLSSADAQASEARRFDIAAQPLASALVEFADKTGMAALVDAELASGKRSTSVTGRLIPQDALRILLAGTGLSFRRAGDTAFTVGPNAAASVTGDGHAGEHRRVEFETYFSLMQSVIEHALCDNADVRPGPYRLVVQVWIGEAGAVDAVHTVGSSGDETRDARITDTIKGARVARPPADMPQPVTVVLHRRNTDAICVARSAVPR